MENVARPRSYASKREELAEVAASARHNAEIFLVAAAGIYLSQKGMGSVEGLAAELPIGAIGLVATALAGRAAYRAIADLMHAPAKLVGYLEEKRTIKRRLSNLNETVVESPPLESPNESPGEWKVPPLPDGLFQDAPTWD